MKSKKALSFVFGIVAVALPALVVVSTMATPACYDRGCDQKGIGTPPLAGRLLDENTWESGSNEADWLDFGAGQQWNFDTTSLGNRQPTKITGYISAQKKWVVTNPDGTNTNRAFTPAGGNVFQVNAANANAVQVQNTTCAQYYLRVVIEADGPIPDAGATDGGDSGDASVADANDGSSSSDATTD